MARPSALFDLADGYVAFEADLDPTIGSMLGVPGADALLPICSPEWNATRADRFREVVRTARSLAPIDTADRRARDLLDERLSAELAAHDEGDWMRYLGAYTGVSSKLRECFDLMPRDSDEAWGNIVSRMSAIPEALRGAQASLQAGLDAGEPAPVRQADVQATQCEQWVADGWFAGVADDAERDGRPAALVADLRRAAAGATDAYDQFARWLRDGYTPHADPADGCGAERYRTQVRLMIGADLDPMEMYAWGWEEYATLRDQIAAECAKIQPGASFAEVVELLEHDPARQQHSVEAYRQWLQDRTDQALERSAKLFDVPERMNRCDVRIPPEGSAAAAYYMNPSEDFSRPGSTWYPTLGRTSFATWHELSTCYHESVPGHHLQLAYAMLQDDLSRFQRLAFVPGHGEGWALYAEQLCDEFGWFELAEYRLGYLAAQQMRAVRVIIDIGMHLALAIPAGATLSSGEPFHPGAVWTPDLAMDFSVSETGNTRDYMRSEIDRYLGWPAQAISYKIGQREWLRARAETQARLGDRFDLRGFHTYALGMGAVGLDQLRGELAHYEPA